MQILLVNAKENLSQDLPQNLLASPITHEINGDLRRNVNFWIKIYTHYSNRYGLVHDGKYVNHIYEVIDLRRSGFKSAQAIQLAKAKWKKILFSVHQKQDHPETMTEDEKKVFHLFQDIDEPNKFLNATHRKRLRVQRGQKEQFLDALYESGRYLPAMEAVFEKEGIPKELTRLPFVESSFNVNARSKVGASGVWQFMRSTAKLFIHVNDAVDERNDPIRASVAAAKLLHLNYNSLQSWALAVTAYNHGRKGLMRAVRKVGSNELSDLVKNNRVRSFGFASSNFFAELIAVIEIEKSPDKYFGQVERAKPLTFYEVTLPDYIEYRKLIHQMGVDPQAFQSLNPAFTQLVWSEDLLIPPGFGIRMPLKPSMSAEAGIKVFWEKYTQIPQNFKQSAQRSLKYGTRERTIQLDHLSL